MEFKTLHEAGVRGIHDAAVTMLDSTGLVDRAAARVREILRTHEVEPLEAAQEAEIDPILAAAGA